MIPPGKRLKVNELADQLLKVARIMELKEELEDAIENVEGMFQNYPRRQDEAKEGVVDANCPTQTNTPS